MLSHSARNEIRKELDSLRALRERIETRINALEAAEQPFEWPQPALFPVRLNSNEKPKSQSAQTGKTHHEHPFASTGLRAAILEVLKEQGPKRAPDVARILAERGFSNDSKTALPIRVYNDLWRMKEAKIVEGSGGLFALKA